MNLGVSQKHIYFADTKEKGNPLTLHISAIFICSGQSESL
jgi:hypothetical protein